MQSRTQHTRTQSSSATPINGGSTPNPALSSPPKPPLSSPINNANNIEGKPTLKRSAPSDVPDSGNNSKIHVSNGYYMSHSATSTMVSSPVAGPSSSDASPSNGQTNNQGQDNNVYMYQNPVYYHNDSSSNQASSSHGTATADISSLPHYLIAPPAPAPPIPYHPHPPLKRWPNDYTVSELSGGFHAMDLLIAHSASGAGMTQRQAFERVFGSRYVKSTVCRHRAVWRKAHQSLREQFEAMGSDDRACWGEFVRRVEGRPPGKGAGASDGMMSPSSNTTMGYHDQQDTGGG